MIEQQNAIPFGFPQDPDGFARVMARRTAWLRRLFGPGAPATSAVQHVLTKTIQMGECRAPARWFWQAVINRLRDRYRREAVAQKYREAAGRANPGLTSPDPDPDAGLIAEETRAEIERAIARLSSADQDLLRRLEAEEPYDSIAAATGRTVLAVKQAVYRARARVLDALNPELRDKILGRLAK